MSPCDSRLHSGAELAWSVQAGSSPGCMRNSEGSGFCRLVMAGSTHLVFLLMSVFFSLRENAT